MQPKDLQQTTVQSHQQVQQLDDFRIAFGGEGECQLTHARNNHTMVHFDFIEVGTSDFDTLLQDLAYDESRMHVSNVRGISIEPLKCYLDRLPNDPRVTKVCAAISNFSGKVKTFYVEPSEISKHQLPHWMRGCNSIITPHPEVATNLKSLKLEHLQIELEVPCMTLLEVVEKFNVSSIGLLKLDCEGHDPVILRNFIETFADKPLELLPKMIQFEFNHLSSVSEVQQIINELQEGKWSYKTASRVPNGDILLQRD